jgi:hypothetical protein
MRRRSNAIDSEDLQDYINVLFIHMYIYFR